MSTLYELTAQRFELQNKLELLNFDEETITDTLEGDSTELEAKIQDYGFVIRNMESFVGEIKNEEVRIIARRKAHEKKVLEIKSWLLKNMQLCGITKIECPAFSITLKNNPLKVIIDNEKIIPDEFLTVPELPEPSPNKAMIAASFKSGSEVAGCHMEPSQRIEIK